MADPSRSCGTRTTSFLDHVALRPAFLISSSAGLRTKHSQPHEFSHRRNKNILSLPTCLFLMGLSIREKYILLKNALRRSLPPVQVPFAGHPCRS